LPRQPSFYEAKFQLDFIDNQLKNIPLFVAAEQKTGVRRAFLLFGLLGFLFLLVFFTKGLDTICNLLGFFYPAYLSAQAIKRENAQELVFWVGYWLVFGLMIVVEDFFDYWFYHASWGPVYFFIKIFFLLWCFFPSTQGARMVSSTFLLPLQTKVENLFQEIKSEEDAERQRVRFQKFN